MRQGMTVIPGTNIEMDSQNSKRSLSRDAIRFLKVMSDDFPKWEPAKRYMEVYPECKSKGSAAVNANRLFRKEIATEYLAYLFREREKAAGVTTEMVLNDIVELKEMCMGRIKTPIMTSDKDGNVFQENIKVFNATGAKGALELLGKHLAMWTDVQTQNNMQVNFNFSLPDEKVIESS